MFTHILINHNIGAIYLVRNVSVSSGGSFTAEYQYLGCDVHGQSSLGIIETMTGIFPPDCSIIKVSNSYPEGVN